MVMSAAREDAETVAPPHVPFEVANVIRRRIVRKEITPTDGDRPMARFFASTVTLLAPRGIYQRALAIAEEHGFPAAHDAHYLARALELACPL